MKNRIKFILPLAGLLLALPVLAGEGKESNGFYNHESTETTMTPPSTTNSKSLFRSDDDWDKPPTDPNPAPIGEGLLVLAAFAALRGARYSVLGARKKSKK